MGKARTTSVEQQLRDAITSDGRALYRLADDAGVPRSTLYDWWSGEGKTIGLAHVSRLCEVLELELQARSSQAAD